MRPLLIGLWVFLAPLAAFAQSDRGIITGAVSDPTRAVLPGTSVVATNIQTGARYETISTETGNYTLVQLPAGIYSLSVELPGFKRYTRQGITVLVAQTLRIDVTLEVGAVSDEVTVAADATLLRTETSEVSHIVAAKSLDDLPILGIGNTLSGSAGIRNPMAMVLLIPGTTFTPNALVRVNGAPNNTQSFKIEGQDAANTGTPGVAAQTQPSIDAVQEVAIQTSNYAAEYGQVGGGMFNVTMRSGTNNLHGTAYNYFVNEALNAGNPNVTGHPDGNPRPVARRNDYGFTLGGPVRTGKLYDGRNKTFFFFNFEQYREITTVNSQKQTVPTLAYRNGDFSSAITTKLIGNDPEKRPMYEGMIYDPRTRKVADDGTVYRDPLPNNRVPPELMDQVALRIQALIPKPSGPTPDGLSDNYLNPYRTSRVTGIPSIKIDHSFGPKGKLSFFWQRTKTENPNGNTIFGQSDGLPDPITTALGTFQTAPLYRLNYDHAVTPTLLLHFGAGYRSNSFFVPSVTTTGRLTNFNAEQELGLHGAIENQFFPPMSGLLTANGTGGMKNFGSSAYSNQITQSPTFNASVTWVKNNHNYKFGSEFRTEGYPPKIRGNVSGSYVFSAAQSGQPFQTTTVNGANVGFPYASFLMGLVNQVSIAYPSTPRIGKKQLGIYVQDSWKVTRKLTLDYGLRYDYSTYLREQYGRAPEFSPTTPNPSAGNLPGAAIYDGSGPGRCGCDIAHNYPYAFGPRLGAAYQITPKTVFRIGAGIVYSSTEGNNNAAGGLASSSATTTTPSFGFPVTTLSVGIPAAFRPAPWPDYNTGRFPSSAPAPGPGPVWMDPNAGRPARQFQWSVGFQREIHRNLVVEAAYVGNRAAWWQAPALLNFNANTPERLKSFGLDVTTTADQILLRSTLGSPGVVARGFKAPYPGFPTTQLLAQALRPFPQFTTIPVYWNPMGRTWYDSLQVKATQRFSHGLSFISTFVWSKSLTLGTETGDPNPGTTGGALVNKVFDRNTNKYISLYDQPFLFNTSFTYALPKVGANKILKVLTGDWTYSAFFQYASGFPLQAPFAQNNLDNYLFQGSSFANRVPGEPLFTVDLNCHCYDPNKTFVLNRKAWVDPAPGQFGNSAAYYSDYRGQRRPIENMNLGRTFSIREGVTFNLRIEFTNVFNRALWYNPSGASLTNATVQESFLPNGNTAAGFGRVITTQNPQSTFNILPRQGVLVGRITF